MILTGKAMKAYLERAQEHEDFMKTQREEFEIGKRHLANMMGEDPILYEDQDRIDVRIILFIRISQFDSKNRINFRKQLDI
jgi:small subunit ribosomal protein S9